MNRRFISYILGWIFTFQGIFLIVPFLLSLIYREDSGMACLISAVICFAIGGPLIFKKPKNKSFYAKDGFVCVALGWIVLSFTGALPFIISREIPDVFDALFETISGYTTTGATVLSDVEAMSKCLLFWRSFTHWIGGMGILVFVLCIIPLAGGNNMHLMRAESPGPVVGKLVPRMRRTALILYGIYTALTVLEIVLLLFGGMNLFEAVTTSFGTAGTGGYAVRNTSIADYSIYIQNVIAIFMALFGVNFAVYFFILIRKPGMIFKHEEVRTYFAIILASTLLIGFNIRESFTSIWIALQQAFFQVSSIITTTGFSTTDFNLWPSFSKAILILLMFIGACASSTGGGIKVSRIIIACKNVKNEISSFIHPKSIHVIRMDGKKVEKGVAHSVSMYLVLYLIVFVCSVLLVSIENYSFETNFTAVAATFNNIGPGLDDVGPISNFGMFSPFSKCVLMFDMLAGRLELIPMMILFSPMVLKRNKNKSAF